MIKPNEIRAGNILNYITDEECLLTTTIDWQDIKYCTENPQDLNRHHFPILLTEEVLFRCGFEKVRYEKYAHNKLNKLRAYPHVMKDGFGVYIMGSYTLPNIKHLHQLQNLFFALTGQELEYRADK